MNVRLYNIPGSHPAMAVQLMLQHKGIPYKRTDLFPVAANQIVRAMGFPGNTIPAMKIDGRKVQNSREISRELDRLQPEPPLFPRDPEKRLVVEEAERFGEEELQHPVRQPIWWALRKDRAPLRSFLVGAKLGIPIGLAIKTAAPVVFMAARLNGSSDENVRAALAALGGLLDRVDELIAAGTIDGEELNAADFQIATTVRLAMTLQDLRPLIESRPAGKHAERVQPKLSGDIPPVLPAAWLEPLKSASAAA